MKWEQANQHSQTRNPRCTARGQRTNANGCTVQHTGKAAAAASTAGETTATNARTQQTTRHRACTQQVQTGRNTTREQDTRVFTFFFSETAVLLSRKQQPHLIRLPDLRFGAINYIRMTFVILRLSATTRRCSPYLRFYTTATALTIFPWG